MTKNNVKFTIIIDTIIWLSVCRYSSAYSTQVTFDSIRHPVSDLKMCPNDNDVVKTMTTSTIAGCANACMAEGCSIVDFVDVDKTCRLYDEYRRTIRSYRVDESCTALRASDRCEIHLIDLNSNLAYWKIGHMSSQTNSRSFSFAVDGQRLGYWTGPINVAATTNTHPVEWMALDLGFNFLIKSVLLWPRLDYPPRLDNLTITMSREIAYYNNPLSDSVSYLCNLTHYSPTTEGYLNTSCMNCNRGFRFVALIAERVDSEIDLAEIEVYGQPEQCPLSFSYANAWTKCLLFVEALMTWDTSLSRCAALSATQIYINSSGEIAELKSFVNTSFVLAESPIVWTGEFFNETLENWSWWRKQDLTWQESAVQGASPQCIAVNVTSFVGFVRPCDDKLPTVCQIVLNA